jgi:tetratricopeptide (TPR) repeat protein
LKEVHLVDKSFQVAKVAELQGDIYWSYHKVAGMDKDNEALISYTHAFNKGNTGKSVCVKIGKCYDRRRDYEDAIRFYERAIKEDANYAVANFRLGWVLVRDGRRKDQGIELIRKSIKMEGGKNATALVVLGEILMREEDKNLLLEAVDYLKEAIKLNEASQIVDCEVVLVLARVYDKLQMIKEAKE